MKLVHISDTHLGFGAYAKIDPVEGINQRESDIYRAFEQAVDKAIELRPDLVVHAGDLFDGVRPQNRAIDLALRQLIRLSEAGIETVIISGNHSTPRLRETGNIFRIFEHLKHIHPVHEPGGKKLVFGDTTVFAAPHSTAPSLAELAASIRPSRDTGRNVLVLHAGVVGSETYRMDEFSEQIIPIESLTDDWDYIALGHYHQFKRVRDRAFYSGSTERLGFGEIGQAKGIVEVDIESHKTAFHELKLRDMVELDALDASGLASSEILREAKDRISASSIDDKIVRLQISNVAPDAYRSLDSPAIRRLGASTLHFELKVERLDAKNKHEQGDAQIGLLVDEFRNFVARQDMTEQKRARLMELGVPYLMREEE